MKKHIITYNAFCCVKGSLKKGWSKTGLYE